MFLENAFQRAESEIKSLQNAGKERFLVDNMTVAELVSNGRRRQGEYLKSVEKILKTLEIEVQRDVEKAIGRMVEESLKKILHNVEQRVAQQEQNLTQRTANITNNSFRSRNIDVSGLFK